MAETPSAYLVVRRDDGFGDVHGLSATQSCTLGRSPGNRVVLKDDLCSREHAEVGLAAGRWRVRDLNSLNGVRVNGERICDQADLQAGDVVRFGRTEFLFVEDMSQLPEPNGPSTDHIEPGSDDSGLSIKKRLQQTRFLVPVNIETEQTGQALPIVTANTAARHALSKDLSLLYRLALQMGTADTIESLCLVVVEGLLEAIPAEVGAILTVPRGREVPTARSARGVELEVTAYRHRQGKDQRYRRVSDFLSNEVLASREAILAEDVERNRQLKSRESISDLGATSLICAPVTFEQKVLGLIHLYCTDPRKALDGEDLEFAVAVAKQLGIVLYQMQRSQTLKAANRSLRDQLKIESELIGDSEAMREIESQIARIAPTKSTCLVRGESGTGKELVARALHYSSPRRDGPFVCLNCAALTETLLESELFGHEKGSFTGATERKIGKFESAHHGTIFLDEIGEMTVGTQAKLLRVLENQPFERVGGSQPILVDVRVIAATNQPLEENVRTGTFRKDLFFRLNVVPIDVPALRKRTSDIPILARHFLQRYVNETGRKIRDFTDAALEKMLGHDWPGNVRELRNVVERAVVLGAGPMLDVGDVWLTTLDLQGSGVSQPPAYEAIPLEELERRHILATLEHTAWNKSAAATILQIERSTLDRKIKAYKIVRE